MQSRVTLRVISHLWWKKTKAYMKAMSKITLCVVPSIYSEIRHAKEMWANL